MKTISLHYETVACKNVEIDLSELTLEQRETIKLYVQIDKPELIHSYLQNEGLLKNFKFEPTQYDNFKDVPPEDMSIYIWYG